MLNLDKHSFNCDGYDPDSYYRFKRRVLQAQELLREARLCLDNRTSFSRAADRLTGIANDAINEIFFQD